MLEMYVIYDHPLDYPNHWVTRRWEVYRNADPEPTEAFTLHATLEAARSAVPPGKHRIQAMSEDDPTIIETWV